MRSTCLSVVVFLASASISSAQVLPRSYLHPAREAEPKKFFVAACAPNAAAAAYPELTTDQQSISLSQGDAAIITGILTPKNNFSGKVTISSTMNPSANAPVVTYEPTIAVPGSTATFVMALSTTQNTAVGDFTLTVQGDSPGINCVTQDIKISVGAASASFLSQGTLQFTTSGTATPAVSIQAIDLYFGGKKQPGVISVRATLPTSSSAPPAGQSVASAPNQNLKTQLLDAFGGVVNVSAGWQSPQDRALTADVRGALKVVEVPQDVKLTSATDSYTQSPFVTGGANVRYSFQGSDRQGNKAIVTLVGSYFMNAVPDSNVAARFVTPLKRVSQCFNGSMTLTFPSAHLYIVAQYRWDSEPQIGHQFVFSVNPAKM